ncbi:MAG: SDR family oxidoreductase [Rhodospirillaceae bacterium]|nr:MAG: SDR family oxidoreductase [Rhodospirillaceae bacterium]
MAKGLFDLSGKVAVVTGGNSGLGLGFARGIAKHGGAVSIWSRRADRNAAAKKELEAYGGRVDARQVDVSSEKDVIAGFDGVMAEFGRIDCVIANAGPPPPMTGTLEQTTKEYHDFLSVAMHGAIYTLREGARHMVKRAETGDRGGSLIACGSLSIFKGLAGKIPYAASKAAVAATIRCMAVEFGKYGIRANVVAPGYIKTGMSEGADAEQMVQIDKYFASRTPIERPGYIEDFEAIAVYLASDASSFHTGDTITIDGGWMVNM